MHAASTAEVVIATITDLRQLFIIFIISILFFTKKKLSNGNQASKTG